jgi:hypothetical protein
VKVFALLLLRRDAKPGDRDQLETENSPGNSPMSETARDRDR